jgi:hypothetical protein
MVPIPRYEIGTKPWSLALQSQPNGVTTISSDSQTARSGNNFVHNEATVIIDQTIGVAGRPE